MSQQKVNTINVPSQSDRANRKKRNQQATNATTNNDNPTTQSVAEELTQITESLLNKDNNENRLLVKQSPPTVNLFNYLKLSFLNTEERQEQFFVLLNSSLKTALFMILEWIPFLVQLYFIGQTDDAEFTGGFGMGLVWSNCFAVGIFGGLGVGVETLASFAYGAQKYKMTGVIFQRGAAIATTLMIPIIFLMWYSDDIIGFVSGKESLGRYAADYCRYGIPGFYLSGIYNIFKGFLTAQNEYSLPLITVSITALSSFFWNWWLISLLDLGIRGAAIARVITESMNVGIILYLVIKNNIHRRCEIAISRLAFQEWGNFLKFAVPIGSLLTLEWLSYEFFTFQASNLDVGSFSAHVIMNNMNTVYYQFGYGVSIAITTFVGNEMGNNSIEKALDYSKQGMMIVFTFLICTQLPFTMMRESFITWFSVDIPTQQYLSDSFTLFQLCMMLDAILAGVTGITRGIGKQNFAAASFIVSYLIVGQIISYLFGFTFDLGLNGIWYGIMFGMICTTTAQLIVAYYSDWNQLLIIIQSNLQKDEQRTIELLMESQKSELKKSLLPVEKSEQLPSKNGAINHTDEDKDLEQLASQCVEIEMKVIKSNRNSVSNNNN